VDLGESLVNVGVIGFFFVLNLTLRSAWMENSYFALDLCLFAVLDAGFILVRDLREDMHLDNYDWGKPVVAMLSYVILVILFQRLRERQRREMGLAFDDFKNRISLHYARERKPESEHELADRLDALEFIERFAEQNIWINVFFKRPRPDKMARTELIVDRLKALAPEGVGIPATDRLYLTRSPLSALAGFLVLVTVFSASVEIA
jgi:hypothetical protein